MRCLGNKYLIEDEALDSSKILKIVLNYLNRHSVASLCLQRSSDLNLKRSASSSMPKHLELIRGLLTLAVTIQRTSNYLIKAVLWIKNFKLQQSLEVTGACKIQ
jgi:hypothetical protein